MKYNIILVDKYDITFFTWIVNDNIPIAELDTIRQKATDNGFRCVIKSVIPESTVVQVLEEIQALGVYEKDNKYNAEA